MRADDCTGAFAVDVEITDVELAHCHFNLVARSGINRTSQAELGIVRDIERLLKVARFNYRQYRTENFLLLELRFRLNICDYGWLDEITFARISGATSTSNQPAFAFSNVDVVHDRLHRSLVD